MNKNEIQKIADMIEFGQHFQSYRICYDCGERASTTIMANTRSLCDGCNPNINNALPIMEYGLKPEIQPIGPRPWFGMEYELKFVREDDLYEFQKALSPLRHLLYLKNDGSLSDPLEDRLDEYDEEADEWYCDLERMPGDDDCEHWDCWECRYGYAEQSTSEPETYSCEIVTEPMDIKSLTLVAKCLISVANYCNAGVDEWCGIHIHIDNKQIKSNCSTMGIICAKSDEYLRDMGRRDSIEYCYPMNMGDVPTWALQSNNAPDSMGFYPWNSHYSACSFTEYTNELRYFQSTLCWHEMKTCIAVANSLHDITRTISWKQSIIADEYDIKQLVRSFVSINTAMIEKIERQQSQEDEMAA